MKKEKLYYIQDTRDYVGNSVVWWAKDSSGYTIDIFRAGKYTKEQAQQICKRKTDKAWLCDHVDANVKHHVDRQYLDNKYSRSWKNK